MPLIDMANHDGLGGAHCALDVPLLPATQAEEAERAAWHIAAGADEGSAHADHVMLVATQVVEEGAPRSSAGQPPDSARRLQTELELAIYAKLPVMMPRRSGRLF